MNGALAGVRIRSRDETLRGRPWPLRRVLWTWAAFVALLIASASAWSVQHGGGDWRVFVSAGARAGTPALLDPPEAWQSFFYLPAVAWAFAPFAHAPLAVSFALDAVLMIACAALAGIVAARTYGLGWKTIAAAYVLWPPAVYAAAIVGQNAPVGLLLAQLAIAGIAARSVALTAVPIGLLLYKPTYAIPFVVLLLARGRLRELAVVCAIGAGWYGASVAATGGQWDWPAASLQLIVRFAAGDLSVNGPFAVSLPALLVRAGTDAGVVVAVVALVAALCLAALRRAGEVEAASAACLAGLALSPHAWAYDAVLALPMIAYAASRLAEPARTCLLFALWLIAPLFFLSASFGFDPLAPVIIGGTLAWLVSRLRRPAAGFSAQAAVR